LLLFQNAEYAEKDRPEFRLVTNDIEEVYKKVAATHPNVLHPNLRKFQFAPGRKRVCLAGRIQCLYYHSTVVKLSSKDGSADATFGPL